MSNQPGNCVLHVTGKPDNIATIKNIFMAALKFPLQDLFKLLKTDHKFYKSGTAGVGIREYGCFGSHTQ